MAYNPNPSSSSHHLPVPATRADLKKLDGIQSQSDMNTTVEDKGNAGDGGHIDFGLNLQHIIHLYTDVMSQLISLDGNKELDLNQLSKDILLLREYFACVVCEKLVPLDFYITSAPSEACLSPHLQCKTCGGKDWVKPCTKHSILSLDADGEEHHVMKVIVESYKGFCSVVIRSSECRTLIEQQLELDPTFEAIAFVDSLTEGTLAGMSSSFISAKDTDQSCEIKDNEELEEEEKKFKTEEVDSLSDIDIEDNTYPNDLGHISPAPVKFTRIAPNLITEFNAQVSPSLKRIQIVHQNTANWPDVNHVIQYASGNMTFSHPNATYTLPVPISLGQPIPQSQVVKIAPCVVETAVRAASDKGRKSKVSHPREGLVSSELSKKTANKTSRKGCRCGNATALPGKLTCCGQRCPCYVERRVCIDCRCKGCRNPHQADGKKIMLLPRERQIIQSTSSEENCFVGSPVSTSNTLTFQTIPDASQTTYTSVFPLNTVASYTAFPMQVPISIVGLSSILQPNPQFSINKY